MIAIAGQLASCKSFLDDSPAAGRTFVERWIWPHVVTAWHDARGQDLRVPHVLGRDVPSLGSSVCCRARLPADPAEQEGVLRSWLREDDVFHDADLVAGPFDTLRPRLWRRARQA